MSTFWCKPQNGSSTGTGAGTSEANAFKGTDALDAAIDAGTVNGGDTVNMIANDGDFGRAEQAIWPAGTNTTSAKTTASAGGIFFGTSTVAGSSCSGITFSFDNTTGRVESDMSGILASTSGNDRTVAAWRFQGEEITVDGLDIVCSDWNYIRTPGGSTRIASTSSGQDAEGASVENCGIIMLGNGNVITDVNIDGSYRFSRYGIYYALRDSGQGGTANLDGYIDDFTIHGVNQGIAIRGTGDSGYTWEARTRLLVRNGVVYGGCWGRESGMSGGDNSGPGYNAAEHGNAIGCDTTPYGGLQISDCEVYGKFQDGIAVVDSGVIRDCYIHDLGPGTGSFQAWEGNGSGGWTLVSRSNSGGSYGNGIKCGLGGLSGTSPTTWLAITGTPGGTHGVAEMRNVIVRNRVYNVDAFGITSNDGGGAYIGFNEVYDCGNSGIVCQTGGIANNYWLQNNYVQKLTSEPSTTCLWIRTNARVYMYNNILASNPSISQTDVRIDAGASFIAKDKNLLTTGRTTGTYSSTGDVSNGSWTNTGGSADWIRGSGLKAASAYRAVGTMISTAAGARSYGTNRYINQQRAVHNAAMNLGPYV